MARNGIAGVYGRFIFVFVRAPHTDFYRNCTSLHSEQQRIVIRSLLHTSSPALIVTSLVDLYISN